jgi:hypothetical protein
MMMRSAAESGSLQGSQKKKPVECYTPYRFIIQDVRPSDLSDMLLLVLLTNCFNAVKENGEPAGVKG